jgi:hypothetical protein
MTKNLVIVAALMTMCGGAMAQDGGTSGGGSLNTNNKFQISLQLGNKFMFDQSLTYLAPKYESGETFGIQGLNGAQSEDPGAYLNIGNIGESSIVNMAGISFAYYIADGIDINMSFGMDLRSTPKQDYLSPITSDGKTIVQGNKYVEGQFKHSWLLSVGSNYHFTTSNEKVDFFVGVQAGFQHGMIETTTPYTDKEYAFLTGNNSVPAYTDTETGLEAYTPSEVVENYDYEVLYAPRTGSGQVNCITAAIVSGVNYSLSEGLTLGVVFAPYTFQYSLMQVCPQGSKVFQANNYANRFFASPMLTLGFRF